MHLIALIFLNMFILIPLGRLAFGYYNQTCSTSSSLTALCGQKYPNSCSSFQVTHVHIYIIHAYTCIYFLSKSSCYFHLHMHVSHDSSVGE